MNAMGVPYSRCSISKIKSSAALKGRYEHDYRTREVLNADPDRMKENDYLIKCDKRYDEMFKDKISGLPYYQNHSIRKNAVMAYDIELGFTEGADKLLDIDIEKWKKDNVEWIMKTFNTESQNEYGNNVVSIVCHMDETVPHIHAIVVPIDPNGKLNASHFTGNRDTFSHIREDYSKLMQKEYGLVPGERMSTIPHWKIRKMYGQIQKTLDDIQPLMIKEGENIKDFEKRVQDVRESDWLAYYKKLSDLEQALEKEKDRYSEPSRDIREQRLAKDNIRLRSEKYDIEREFGSVRQATELARLAKDFESSKEEFPDQKQYDDIMRGMAEIVAWFRKNKKDKEKEREYMEDKEKTEKLSFNNR